MSKQIRKPRLHIVSYRNYKFRILPFFLKRKLMWKDKFGTPRCEREPYFTFEWLWFVISGVWEDDDYWEQKLWISVYNDMNYEKAKSTWPWTTMDDVSTWKDY